LFVVFDNLQFRQVKNEQKKVPAAYGVIIKLDLFDHSYTEMKWLHQHPSRSNGAEIKFNQSNGRNECRSIFRSFIEGNPWHQDS
jgi:hypothetical protein